MTVTDKTRKLLWGRSGNLCAFCKNELIMDATPLDDESVVGDECHVVSGKPNGPRYDPGFPPDEIDSYRNLILLCRVHHKMIDDQPENFTTDILRQLKANHARWVADALESIASSESLSLKQATQAAFLRVKVSMPELLAEMKQDLTKEGNQFIREFFIMSKRWTLNAVDPCFVYYFEDHENLQGKMHILENCGFVIDVTPKTAKKYRMTEEFVELLLVS